MRGSLSAQLTNPNASGRTNCHLVWTTSQNAVLEPAAGDGSLVGMERKSEPATWSFSCVQDTLALLVTVREAKLHLAKIGLLSASLVAIGTGFQARAQPAASAPPVRGSQGWR